eukprot:14044966-Alexandrium_andersonii.AAC.1
MRNGFGRSSLELRGPRSGLDIAPRSHRGVDKAPQAPSRSFLNSKLPNNGSCVNSELPNFGKFFEQATPEVG